MSTVTLTIGPKSYPVACADGEEAHITALGAMIAEKYALLGSARAPLEAQNLLFAALFLADELAEARKGKPGKAAKAASQDTSEADALRAEIARLEAELAQAKQAPPAPQADLFGGPDASGTLADRLEALAAEAEASAAALEAAATNA
ncbi:MAG: cell division protein ZapA [Erythrobacter sp.]|nr:cell division protein ZapA [Erythrobacter sp.]